MVLRDSVPGELELVLESGKLLRVHNEKGPSIHLGAEQIFISRERNLRTALRLRKPLCLLTEQGAGGLSEGRRRE